MAGDSVFFVNQWIRFVENTGDNFASLRGSYNYYYSIFSSYPFSSPIYVNNILEREKQEETPIKWGKKRLKIFP